MRGESIDFDHLEIVLGGAAVRARPGIGYIAPACAWLDALFRQPQRFVINEAANHAHPFAQGGVGGSLVHGCASPDRVE